MGWALLSIVCCERGYTTYNEACCVGHHGIVQLEKWPVEGTPCDVPHCPYISWRDRQMQQRPVMGDSMECTSLSILGTERWRMNNCNLIFLRTYCIGRPPRFIYIYCGLRDETKECMYKSDKGPSRGLHRTLLTYCPFVPCGLRVETDS